MSLRDERNHTRLHLSSLRNVKIPSRIDVKENMEEKIRNCAITPRSETKLEGELPPSLNDDCR